MEAVTKPDLKYLEEWERPSCYVGATWYGWYVGLGRTRGSDTLTESNFETFLKRVKAASTDNSVYHTEGALSFDRDVESVTVVRESHSLCGWIEWIAIHPRDVGAVQEAERLLKELHSYPVLDEDDWSNREYEAIHDYWERCSVAERQWLCDQADEDLQQDFEDNYSVPAKVYDYLRDTGGF